MADKQEQALSEIDNNSEFYMKSDIVDQSNIISQSNMALSVYSVITQSYSSVKIINSGLDEDYWYRTREKVDLKFKDENGTLQRITI